MSNSMMWGLFHEIFEKLVANYFSKKFRKAITTWGGGLGRFEEISEILLSKNDFKVQFL